MIAIKYFILPICGIIASIPIAYLNSLYDITGFYLFFIIPVGAVGLGLLSNAVFIALAAFLKERFSYSTLQKMIFAGLIAIFCFWLSQYLSYYRQTITIKYIDGNGVVVETKKEPISLHHNFKQYIIDQYKKMSFQVFGIAGKIPIITPSMDMETGLWGLILLFVKQLGLILALPISWLWTGDSSTRLKYNDYRNSGFLRKIRKSLFSHDTEDLKYRNWKVVICRSCGQKIRFPNKKIVVTCPKCKYSFSYEP